MTTTANRSVPWQALVTITLVYRGDGFGLVGTEELKHNIRRATLRKDAVGQDLQFGKSIRDTSVGASWSDGSSGCHSRSYEAA